MTKNNIQDLFPVLQKGWVAMDKDGCWCWFSSKPIIRNPDDTSWDCGRMNDYYFSFEGRAFDIKKVRDWRTSLVQVQNEKH